MSLNGSSSSSTQVAQHYPTWGGPNIPAAYGDNTAYDLTDGPTLSIGSNWMPMYLAAALTVDSYATGAYKAAHLNAYSGSMPGVTVDVTASAGHVASVANLTGANLANGQVVKIGNNTNPAIGHISNASVVGNGLTVNLTVNPTPHGYVIATSIANGGVNYIANQPMVVDPNYGNPYYFTILTVNSLGSALTIGSGHYGGSAQAYDAGVHTTIMYGGAPISTPTLIIDYPGDASSGYTSATYTLYPYIPGQPLALFSNAGVTGDASSDGITYAANQSKYANLTTYEKSAMSGLATRAANGDVLAGKGLALLNLVLDGTYLLPSGATFQAVLALILTPSQNDFTSKVFNKLTAKTFINGNTDTTFQGQSLVTAGDTSNKWSARITAMLNDDNYRTERDHQNNSTRVSLSYGEMDYINAEALRMAGFWNRQYVQGRLKDNHEVILGNDIVPYNALQVLGNAVGGMIGMKTSVTKPLSRPSGWIGVAGGALAGAAGGPVGAGIGAALGLLSSMSSDAQF